jgi:hypothetical protein
MVQWVATRLNQDLVCMRAEQSCSLLGKWLPTERGSLDTKTNIVKKDLCTALEMTPRQYRTTLTGLRGYLRVVEPFMCNGKWSQIDYSKVPSCAMRKLKAAFEKHSPTAFAAWKASLVKGEAKVNAKQLFPHDLVRDALHSKCDVVAEEQWKVLEQEVEKLGNLGDSLVIADVSGSMFTNNDTPISVSIALGILVSHATKGTFHNHVMTFHSRPSFFLLREGASLNDRVRALKEMDWGGNTDFLASHQLIVGRARACGLTQADMPKRIFVISDMQFDSAFGSNTNFEQARMYYTKAGYEMPQMVFWNVNGASTDFPVTVDDRGTALISGFSPAILKAVIETNDFSPVGVMRAALDDKRYDPVREALGA